MDDAGMVPVPEMGMVIENFCEWNKSGAVLNEMDEYHDSTDGKWGLW